MNGLDIIQHSVDGIAVLCPFRDFTRAHYSALPQTVAGLLAGDTRGVVLDLHDVHFADSTGISILLSAHKAAVFARKPLVLCNVSRYFQNIITALNLCDVFTIRGTEEQARAECGDHL